MKVNPKEEYTFEDGQYPAVVESVEEVETKFGQRLIWKFDTTAEDGNNYEVVGFTSLSPSVKGNLVNWSKAILGEVTEGFDTDDLTGMPCVVVIEEFEDANGFQKNKVTKVKAPKKGAKAKSAKTATDDENAEDFESIPF